MEELEAIEPETIEPENNVIKDELEIIIDDNKMKLLKMREKLLSLNNDDEVLEENNEIEKAIRNAAPYSHVKKNKTASNNSFIYYLEVSGSIFPKKCWMTFYDDGYVSVESGDVNFIYSFDAQKAKELYTSVTTYVEDIKTTNGFTVNYKVETNY